MTKYCCYLIRPGSKEIERFEFDSFQKCHKFECSKLYSGWTGCAGPDLPHTIEVECYEQLRLF